MSWNNGKHHEYDKQDWSKLPSIFAEEVFGYIPKSGKILEIGSGLGQDSRFFHQQGYEIYSTDYSSEAIKLNTEKSSSEILSDTYHCIQLDITQGLGFSEGEFDVVYAHLSLHYFSQAITKQITADIRRVLRKGGIFAVFLNSVDDTEYGIGTKLEEDYYEIRGVPKRYFSIETARELYGEGFEILMLDNQGETYKDREKGIHNMIRFVGKKI